MPCKIAITSAALFRSRALHRLVGQDQAGLLGQGAGDPHPLLLAA
jgi:hypothetical protein